MAQVVEHLPSKYEALSSNSSTAKKIKQTIKTTNLANYVKSFLLVYINCTTGFIVIFPYMYIF
jgi:hypothetical protein